MDKYKNGGLGKKDRLSTKEKEANDKQWYKDKFHVTSRLSMMGETSLFSESADTYTRRRRMLRNYNLCNNKLDMTDFERVINPTNRKEYGRLPVDITNKDIISGKVKVLLGKEMQRDFNYTLLATNPEATTMRERKHMELIKSSTIDKIMAPIREQVLAEAKQSIKGRELSPDESKAIEESVSKEIDSRTPEEIETYMRREYQTPVEAMSQQLLNYVIKLKNVKDNFNDCFEHGLKSGVECMFVSEMNGQLVSRVVNPLQITFERNSDNRNIENAESVCCRWYLTRSEVMTWFGDELTDEEIDSIYENKMTFGDDELSAVIFSDSLNGNAGSIHCVEVSHCVWRSLRKIGFLTYIDEESRETTTKIVDETYKMNEDFGDVSVEWQWVPEIYEAWRLMGNIYKKMRPVPGQFTDMSNIYEPKHPYIGIIHDNINSDMTCFVDRLVQFQYDYNIISYKRDLLIASDKGKRLMLDISLIPSELGYDKFEYYADAIHTMYVNPNQPSVTESSKNLNMSVKELDLSTTSDIMKYQSLLEAIRQQAGRTVGVDDTEEGQIRRNEAVGNTQQSLVQTSYIQESCFRTHDTFKRNCLIQLLEMAKVVYATDEGEKKLSYVMDDMSISTFSIEGGLMKASTVGIFLTDDGKGEGLKQIMNNLAHAAMQNQQINLSDVLKVFRSDSFLEGTETLEKSERAKAKEREQAQMAPLQAQKEQEEAMRQFEAQKHEWEKELIILKAEKEKEIQYVRGMLLAASYNPETDANKDGVNDFVSAAQKQMDLKMKGEKMQMDESFRRDKLALDKERFDLQRQQSTAKQSGEE